MYRLVLYDASIQVYRVVYIKIVGFPPTKHFIKKDTWCSKIHVCSKVI